MPLFMADKTFTRATITPKGTAGNRGTGGVRLEVVVETFVDGNEVLAFKRSTGLITVNAGQTVPFTLMAIVLDEATSPPGIYIWRADARDEAGRSLIGGPVQIGNAVLERPALIPIVELTAFLEVV